jgi:hypothetical protein
MTVKNHDRDIEVMLKDKLEQHLKRNMGINFKRNHPLICYKDNDISFNKSNKLASCQGFLHGFVSTCLQVEQCGLLSLLVLGEYLMSLFQKWRIGC